MCYSVSWTSVLNNRMTNELKFGHVRESLLQGPRAVFDDNWKFIGFRSLEPFDVGSANAHPDYLAGPRNTYAQDLIRDFTFDDTLTWIKSGWHGDHTFKAGAAYSRNAALPLGSAVNFIGQFDFLTNAPFNQANPSTYPRRFQIRMGQFDFDQIDHQASGFIQDKWQVNRRLTLNLGVRYDWQELVKTQGRDRSPIRRRLRSDRQRQDRPPRRRRQGLSVSAARHPDHADAERRGRSGEPVRHGAGDVSVDHRRAAGGRPTPTRRRASRRSVGRRRVRP